MNKTNNSNIDGNLTKKYFLIYLKIKLNQLSRTLFPCYKF